MSLYTSFVVLIIYFWFLSIFNSLNVVYGDEFIDYPFLCFIGGELLGSAQED